LVFLVLLIFFVLLRSLKNRYYPFVQRFQQIVIGILGLLLVIVILQSVVPQEYVSTPQEPVQLGSCLGDPIEVDYAYTGTVADPWTCQVQCEDDVPRYILYTNGRATQCETPPGCNDYGEDHGITCQPPGQESAVGTSEASS